MEDRNNGHHPVDQGGDFWGWQFSNVKGYDAFNHVLQVDADLDDLTMFAKSVFSDEKKANAVVRLWHRHRKFKDNVHQGLLLAKCASTIGVKGRGRVEGVFAETNLLAPDMFRTVAGLPRYNKKNGEEVIMARGSNFNRQDKPESNMDGSIK